jgi:ankyrin repeat protein
MKIQLMVFSFLLSISNLLLAQEPAPVQDSTSAGVTESKQTPDVVDDTQSGDAEKAAQAAEPANVPPALLAKNNALLQSVWDGDLDKVQLLLVKGADVNFAGDKKRTPLMIAVYRRNLDLVEFLVSKGADVNARDGDGQTALIYSCRQRKNATPDNSIALFLLNNGADVNLRSTKKGFTALMIAAEAGNVELVQKLLEKGADPAIKDNFGVTAAFAAQKTGHQDVVDLLSDSSTPDAVQ